MARIDGIRAGLVRGLLPCPFCGHTRVGLQKVQVEGRQEGEIDAFQFYVFCTGCACHGGWAKSESGARRLWNMRAWSPTKADVPEA